MKKEDIEKATDHMVSLVGGLLGENSKQALKAYEDAEGVLAIQMRLSMKNVDGKLQLKTTLSFAESMVKDQADDIIDFDQKEMDFEGQKKLSEAV